VTAVVGVSFSSARDREAGGGSDAARALARRAAGRFLRAASLLWLLLIVNLSVLPDCANEENRSSKESRSKL
jgi:hypothetical protein